MQEEAIRFGTKENAPKIDLSDYLLELESNSGVLSLGHVNFEANSLLAESIQSRGTKGSYQLSDWADITFTGQHGREVVGYSNITGLADFGNNRAVSVNLGLNLLNSSAHNLRLDLTYLSAKITSEPAFDFEEATDAEKSSGYGLMLSGNNENDTLRGNLTLARSTYNNPLDHFLAQDLDIIESESTTDSSYTLDIEWDLIKSHLLNDDLPLTVTLGWNRSQKDPLYNSVMSNVTPDLKTNNLNMSVQLGDVNLQFLADNSRDNLDNIDTILTTETNIKSMEINFPVQSLLGSESKLIPEFLSFNYGQTMQAGKNTPVDFDPDSHIPEQLTTTTSLVLNWLLGAGNFSYQYSVSDQDNRQLGRQNADFKDTNNTIALDYPISETLAASLSLSQTVAEDVEQQLDRTTKTVTLNTDWLVTTNWSLVTNIDYSKSSDSNDIGKSTAVATQLQAAYRFNYSVFNRKLPGQLFIRYSEDRLAEADTQFEIDSSRRIWAINAGINVTLF